MYDDLYFSPYFYRNGSSLGGGWDTHPTQKDWTCEYCGSLHPGSAYTCNRCGAPRRAERPTPAPRSTFSIQEAAIWEVLPPAVWESWLTRFWNDFVDTWYRLLRRVLPGEWFYD